MISFVSEESHAAHLEYHRRMLLRISTIEREMPELAGKSVAEILPMCRKYREGGKIAELYASAGLHEVFFDSFTESLNSTSTAIRSEFGSESAFRDKLLCEAMRIRFGFAALIVRRRSMAVCGFEDPRDAYLKGVPILAVDACEHAYLRDWGFDKEGYVRAAVARLRLSKLEE